MANGKHSPLKHRDIDIKEDHSYSRAPGMLPGKHKRYHARVGGRTVKGSLDEVKAAIDYHIDNKPGTSTT